ncbi:MAG: transcriptional regulator, TetR family [Devosia sp.]|uniref:TetR family transcriptional regulator n=1 Tax=Devosia sp. TaxID=1871048 RepID=UPI00262FA172|nr:TetR family transcriptional regulator [Devosia sp.]MDB5587247.1 transcriptional regulator, TetR family [Devosia sp.]
MANAEATRERILNAAMGEFAAFGIAGARVDRIAKEAGCNKNLIYIYFDSKEKLFTRVLEHHLSRVYVEVTFSPDDLPGYAMRVFDFAIANPAIMRLMAWFSLEQPIDGSPTRNASIEGKLAEIRAAQQRGSITEDFAPDFLLTTIMTLATAWTSTNPFGRGISPDLVQARRNIGRVVTLLSGAE